MTAWQFGSLLWVNYYTQGPGITLFPTYSSLLITCPCHRILRSWTFFEISHFRASSDFLVSDLVQPSDTRTSIVRFSFLRPPSSSHAPSSPPMPPLRTPLLVLLSSCKHFPWSWLSFFCHKALQTLSSSSSTCSELYAYGWLLRQVLHPLPVSIPDTWTSPLFSPPRPLAVSQGPAVRCYSNT